MVLEHSQSASRDNVIHIVQDEGSSPAQQLALDQVHRLPLGLDHE